MKKVFVDFKAMIAERERLNEINKLEKKTILEFIIYNNQEELIYKIKLLFKFVKSLFYVFLALLYKTPGLYAHLKIIRIYLILWKKGVINNIYELLFNITYPLDSVRYFEFKFFLKHSKYNNRNDYISYLDVSSPRMLFSILLKENPTWNGYILNPDKKDLDLSKKIIESLSIPNFCRFYDEKIEDLDFPDESFDIITCMSVLEHIPNGGDILAINKLWRFLKKGGVLLVSFPVKSEAMDEYINFFDYGLYSYNGEYVFGQRFYDENLINELFANLNPPKIIKIYGEKTSGFYENMRKAKVIYDQIYPVFKEAYLVGRNFRFYKKIDKLPGCGVAFFKFIKE